MQTPAHATLAAGRTLNAALPWLAAGLTAIASPAHAGHFAYTSSSAYLCADPLSCSPTLGNWAQYVTDGSYFYYSPRLMPNLLAQTQTGGSFESFNLSTAASADLATGTLRSAARIDNAAPAQNRTAFASSQAWIGDSFSFTSAQGSPFAWAVADTATLNLRIDGTLANTSADPFPASYGVQFAVRQHGAIQSQNGTPLTALGGVTWSQWFTVNGPGGYSASTSGALPITTAVTGSLATGDLNLAISFKPGGDFDWDLVLYTDARLTDLPGSKLADFSHTMHASFIAPAAAVVSSSSGVFPVTSAVPEPATGLLGLAGLLALRWTVGSSRRHRP
jgi:hypothetical protein